MIIGISSSGEADVADGYWFYERQSVGLGDYFRTCIFADIESLVYFAGIHEIENGFYRSLSKRFPFGIYYTIAGDYVTIVAILDLDVSRFGSVNRSTLENNQQDADLPLRLWRCVISVNTQSAS